METVGKKSFATGDVIFRQGDSSTELYHVLSGRVGISIAQTGGNVLLADLGPGSLFGEMALIIGPPRTATATALTPVTVNVVPESVFRQNVLGLPEWALSIARVLADRLRNTTHSLDKLVYDQEHRSDPETAIAAGLSIVPQALDISYYPEADAHRLYLSGVLDQAGLGELTNRINALRRQAVSPVILNFSNVIDVHKPSLVTLLEMARTATEAVGRIEVENVQLIADRLQNEEGLSSIIRTSQAPLRRVGYDDHLVRQGESGTEMFVVKTGSLTIYRTVKDKEIVLWKAGEGDVIGEMALISGKARSASIKADKTSQVYVLDLAEFQKNAYHIPRWFMSIIEGLVTRLRNTDKKLDDFLSGALSRHESHFPERLEIFENFRRPGACSLQGTLSSATTKELKVYILSRLKRGVRHFDLDLTRLDSFDEDATRCLVKLQRYLIGFEGSLTMRGAREVKLPVQI